MASYRSPRLLLLALLLAQDGCLGALSLPSLEWEDPPFPAGCTPVCTGESPGMKIRDPTNCRRYYICLADGEVSDFTEECGEDEFFHPDKTECEKLFDSSQCLTCEPPCKFTCSVDNIEAHVIADRVDCSVFHICISGEIVSSYDCRDDDSSRPFFNGTSCTDQEASCCDGCFTFCPQANVQIADPYNCTNFYFCERKGSPEEDDIYSCPVGNFDESLGHCSEAASCYQPCLGTTTDPTLSTTPDPASSTTPDPASSTTPGTTATSTDTTTDPIDAPDCKEEHICKDYFPHPVCTNRCVPEYFECPVGNLNQPAFMRSCPSPKMLHPDRVACVSPNNCPYPPLRWSL